MGLFCCSKEVTRGEEITKESLSEITKLSRNDKRNGLLNEILKDLKYNAKSGEDNATLSAGCMSSLHDWYCSWYGWWDYFVSDFCYHYIVSELKERGFTVSVNVKSKVLKISW